MGGSVACAPSGGSLLPPSSVGWTLPGWVHSSPRSQGLRCVWCGWVTLHSQAARFQEACGPGFGRFPHIHLLGLLYIEASGLVASLGHPGRRRVVLGHTLSTLRHIITKIPHNVLSTFTTLCWATFTAILGRRRPAAHGLDTPALSINW